MCLSLIFFFNSNILHNPVIDFNTNNDDTSIPTLKLASNLNTYQSSEAFFNFSNYYLFLNPETWHRAKSNCEDLGYHLVTISSQDENFFVSGFKQDVGLWLGITDELTEGVWEWVTGEPVVFTNWNEGQPDDFGTGEDYGVIEQDELWNDIGLLQGIDQRSPYICEAPQNFENDGPSKAIFNAS